MNRLQLATLLSWAGDKGLDGRKRLQKVVYFLQHAGCPLDCAYTLHHYGPYSRDVADACDEMVAAGLVEESGGPAAGTSYSYKLDETTQKYLGSASRGEMERFQTLGADLINENLWSLELGSTVLYFFGLSEDWDTAFTQACAYKNVGVDTERSQSALDLAKKTHAARIRDN